MREKWNQTLRTRAKDRSRNAGLIHPKDSKGPRVENSGLPLVLRNPMGEEITNKIQDVATGMV